MIHPATAAVARYWTASEAVAFDTSDKQQIYDLLGRAEGLIARLDFELEQRATAAPSEGVASRCK